MISYSKQNGLLEADQCVALRFAFNKAKLTEKLKILRQGPNLMDNRYFVPLLQGSDQCIGQMRRLRLKAK